ncbi:phosphonate C-P lyase system protein PhnG [Iningainema tapete]|uniref:Phosphonate C-P lyase system protein PhnG n=1 Tax=Iningainema tapete BLCC-T55 TaxID=2748662 RepID=A0A8J7CD86_9CYAN|nr:phosphonate C-P lyase system protein PhnG [Iningainema tapete]MBD2772710.1 phosphonate C-P lyase system protein PhnG [Iningainema tapete BLCC-T55]
MKIPSRCLWIRALTAHSPHKLVSLAEDLTSNMSVNYKSLPEAGLSLLQMEDGVFHEPYYLGEIPVASAWIEITNSRDESFEGAAQVMSDSADLAVALAICDAIMAHQLPGWQKVADLIDKGIEKRTLEEAQRGAILAKTKVNFSLLSQEEEDAED